MSDSLRDHIIEHCLPDDETERAAVAAHYERLKAASDETGRRAAEAHAALSAWTNRFLSEWSNDNREAVTEAMDARILPPVWDEEAQGWRCPYPHEPEPGRSWFGLRDVDDRRLVAQETVDDWRNILDPDDPETDHERGPVMLVGDSSFGDGSLDCVACRNCQRDVDITEIDLDYV